MADIILNDMEISNLIKERKEFPLNYEILFQTKDKMDIALIESGFKKKICEKIEIFPEGQERFKIFTPFMFADGDHLVSVLKKLPKG